MPFKRPFLHAALFYASQGKRPFPYALSLHDICIPITQCCVPYSPKGKERKGKERKGWGTAWLGLFLTFFSAASPVYRRSSSPSCPLMFSLAAFSPKRLDSFLRGAAPLSSCPILFSILKYLITNQSCQSVSTSSGRYNARLGEKR